jgi:hypothetical protein
MEVLMSLEQVAAVFGRSERWVKDTLIKPKAIEYVKLGATYYFTERALRDCIARKTTKTHVRQRW